MGLKAVPKGVKAPKAARAPHSALSCKHLLSQTLYFPYRRLY